MYTKTIDVNARVGYAAPELEYSVLVEAALCATSFNGNDIADAALEDWGTL